MKLRKVKNNPPDKYYKKLAQVESGGDPTAKAKTSSAAGLYQFTEGTWDSLVKDLDLNYTLEDRFDPDKSRKVVEAFTQRNERSLERRLGRKPNDAELYLAHFSGAGGAGKLLDTIAKNPNTPVTDFVSPGALKANKNVFFNKDGSAKKAFEIYNWSAKKFDVDQMQAPEEVVEEPEEPKGLARPQLELPTMVRDNTSVRIPNLATPTFAGLPDMKQAEEVQEKQGMSEETVRQLLSQEKKATEQRFLQAFQQQQADEQPNYTPSASQEDLSHLYNYIRLDD